AEGLLADGITVNHAPVCDVNVEPRNPVIGTRSFGDDAERVAQFTAAWVRGSERAGVASTPKHFPGHGDTSLDSHFTRPDVTADRATLDRRELLPFRAAFAAGATTVMSAHIRYTALDTEAPATISRPILTDLLRRELRFDGLSMTDSRDMVPRALRTGGARYRLRRRAAASGRTRDRRSLDHACRPSVAPHRRRSA